MYILSAQATGLLTKDAINFIDNIVFLPKGKKLQGGALKGQGGRAEHAGSPMLQIRMIWQVLSRCILCGLPCR